jgi:peptidoglycan/LPS O-acetylase OafA/YrhL
MTAPQSRPRVVTAAFWCWVVASFLLILGGLIAASLNLPVAFRGAGIILALAGGGLAFLTGRTRSGDTRFRRAAIALALTLILLVALAALFRLVNGITLLAVLPLIAGTVLISRPSAASPSEQEPQ